MNQSILNFPNPAIRKGSNLSTLHYIIAYLILLVTILSAYYPAFDNDFVYWDDQYYITQNIYLAQPSLANLKVLLTKAISLNYHPITMFTLWCNSYVSGIESATPFIITNVIIHTAACISLFHFLLRLSNNHLWLSGFVTLIFAIHPLHTESIIWVSERKDVLYALFFFLSLHQYVKYLDNKKWTSYMLALFFFVCSCLSKGMAVSLVPVLFLVDYHRNKVTFSRKYLLLKLPFIIIGLIVGLIAISIQSGGDFMGLISNSSLANALIDQNNFTALERLQYTGYSITYYVISFFNWTGISAFHPYLLNVHWSYALIPLLFLLGLFYTFLKEKKLFFGLCFFLMTLILVLPYIQLGSAVMADRYTYLPYVGMAYAVGVILYRILKGQKYFLYALLFSLTIFCILTTRSHSDLWQNHIVLFQNVVEKYPEDARSRTILASGYWKEGQIDKAIEEQEFAINKLGLYTSEGFENLATFYSDKGETDKALAFYNHSISLNTNNIVARYHRGLLLLEKNPEKAIEDFNICEQLGDEYIVPLIYSPRGNGYGRLQKYEQAIADFSKAIELNQDLIISYEDRAMTYQLLGELELAEKDLEMVQVLKNAN